MQTKNLVHDNDSSISKTMAIAFVASALWSASAVASADSTSLTSNQSSTTEVSPSSDTPIAETPKNSASSSTSDSSTPATDTPSAPEAPKVDDKGKDGASEENPKSPEAPGTSDSNVEPGKEKENPDTAGVVTEKPKPAVEVPKQNNGTVDSGTVLQPQKSSTPTITPSVEEPVITDQGYKIVDVAKSTLTLENADGTQVKVNPELIGGVTNDDGTVTFKNSKGGIETLPETGVVESMFLTLIGFLLLFFGFKLLSKSKVEQSTYTYL